MTEAIAARYRVLGRIGRGGVAEVLEAVIAGDQNFERKVAIKRLLPEAAADEGFVRAFIDEARIIGQLHHPGIVGVYDLGSNAGVPFIVLELVDGMNLIELEAAARAKGLSVPLEVALHAVTEVAHALHYAHTAKDSRGERMSLVHRDVNPRNILVSWRGDVKLTDFGIARAARRLEATLVGIVKGTLGYMAPEQQLGRDVDARADVFSLGCTLHRLIAGRSPLEDDEVRRGFLARGVLGIDPVVPREVAGIIERATRYAREERYASAAEFAARSGAVLAASVGGDIRTRVLTWIEKLRAGEKRRARHAVGDLFAVELVGAGVSEIAAVPAVDLTPGVGARASLVATVPEVDVTPGEARVSVSATVPDVEGAALGDRARVPDDSPPGPSLIATVPEFGAGAGARAEVRVSEPDATPGVGARAAVVARAPDLDATPGVGVRAAAVARGPDVAARGAGPPPVPPPSSGSSEPRATGDATPAAGLDPMIGSIVHGFRVLERLGSGAWANVYRARHQILERECAVKVMRPDRAHSIQSKRLYREAQLASKLDHPNLVRIFDCGETAGGLPFLTMELLQGMTLADVLRRDAPLSRARAARIMRDIARGLAEAHAHGLVHRDLKPGNIMIVGEGEVETAKVLDFGIVRALDPDVPRTQLTAIDRLLGTPKFMAPEQILGASTVHTAADIYALGAVAFIFLTGRAPFTGSVTEIVEHHLHTPPPPLPHAGGLGPLVMRMLSKDPSARPTANEILRELDRLEPPGADEEETDVDRHPSSPTDKSAVTVPERRRDALSSDRTSPPRASPLAWSVVTDPAGSDDTPVQDTASLTLRRPEPRGRSRSPARSQGAPVMLIVAMIVLAAMATALVVIGRETTMSPPAGGPVAESPAKQPAVIALPRPEPKTSTASAREPAGEEEAGVVPAKNTRAARPARKVRDESIDDLRARIDRALESKGLLLADLDEGTVAAWRASNRNDEAAATALLAAIDAQPIDAALVQRRLERIKRQLGQAEAEADAERYKTLVQRYFELRTKYRPTITGPSATDLAKEAADLEAELRQTKSR